MTSGTAVREGLGRRRPLGGEVAGAAALLALALSLAAALPARAVAAERDERVVVAVLPFGADDGMQIYGKPVADAVAQRLARDRRMAVEPLSLSGSVPARVDLVIDGRIASHGDGAVALEARVRDPARGRLVAVAATGARPLAQIDALADELARKLATPLAEAAGQLRRQRSAEGAADASRAGPIRLPETVVSGRSPAGASSAADRPKMVVMQATGSAAGGAVPVGGVVTRAGYRLADALGFAPVATAQAGVVEAAVASAEIDRAGGALALMLDVHEIAFSWSGVLTARGRVRVVVVEPGGRAIYDRVVRTDTLVGNRGDRHLALVHFVAEQVVDIAAPEIRRRIAR